MTIYGSETQMEGWYTDARERSNETPSVEYKEAEADAEEIKVLDAIFLCSFDDFNDRHRVWRTMGIHMDN